MYTYTNVTGQGTYFREDQEFRQPWLWILLVALTAFAAGIVSVSLAQQPADSRGTWTVALMGVGVPVAAAVLLYVLKLSVSIDDRYLHVRYFPLLRRDIPLEDIVHFEVRTYRPIREYGGWGIRYSFGRGMAFNVSGNRGVQLELKNGKRVLIGSQRPEELAAALARVKQGR